MKKQVFALLMAALLLLTACSAPAPAQTAAAEPTQAPVEPAAPTEVPAPEPTATEEPQPESAEFQLEREAGCNQLSIYWTRSSIDFDTSDMWIWFKGKDGRSYPMHQRARERGGGGLHCAHRLLRRGRHQLGHGHQGL